MTRVESLPPEFEITVSGAGGVKYWREHIEIGEAATATIEAEDGMPVLIQQGRFNYMAGWGNNTLLNSVMTIITQMAGLSTITVPEGLSLRRNGKMLFAFNYSQQQIVLSDLGIEAKYLLGSSDLAPSGVSIGTIT